MFTGIVTAVGELAALEDGPVRRFTVRGPWPADDLVLGASIAHDGVCLTVTHIEPDGAGARYQLEVSPETLARTTLGDWKPGTAINLERPLKVGDELGGHIVQGHVDGVGTVKTRTDTDGWMALRIEAPADLAPFIAQKGSIAVDGVSLTVNGVTGNAFDLMIIPHTAAVTTLSRLKPGMRVNLEVDIMARYAARLAAAAGPKDAH
ncbi:riboflavin synthase [Glycocaulis abyssi]|uniref:Riboflavin synthase n=1 Tax=Glycocaulis abyssi TaxID=1433403 RepID=A0ABV9N9G9_9PROT